MDKHTFSGKERETTDKHSQTSLGYQVVAFKCFHMLSHFHCVFTSTVNREGGRVSENVGFVSICVSLMLKALLRMLMEDFEVQLSTGFLKRHSRTQKSKPSNIRCC